MSILIRHPQGAIKPHSARIFGTLRGPLYIYLPGGSVSAVASLLLIHRFEGICTAGGPIRSIDDHSSSPRRAIVLVAMLLAAKSMLVAEGFPKGFSEGFRTVTRTVCQTVSVAP
ncbi:hypothetical protein I5U65_07495 [Stenotrophomonas maltophilia]|nr:hypothetical protein [Stenotrophomonas maltophilia]